MANIDLDQTKWLKSPITEKTQRLQPLRDVLFRPYYGAKKRIRILRTSYSIGSDPSCDIHVDDPFVSPQHANLKIAPGGEGYFVEDLNSRNGVFLNGVRVQRAPLPDVGLLRIGRSTFAWQRESTDELQNDDWIVADPFMKETLLRLRTVAKSSLSILLLGETGTGKEILANLLHQWSGRATGPFVPMNGALTGGSLADSELFGHQKGAYTGSENSRIGAIRSAHGGTLFLDEIADIPAAAQVKLLRALESGEVKALGSDRPDHADFRLVSATSQNIEAKVAENSFRIDLYYRIAGYVVHIPPLRERPLDILAISKKLLEEKGFELDSEAEGRLLSYSWPGNVRELKSAIERAMVLARSENAARILPAHFQGFQRGIMLRKQEGPPQTLESLERESIQNSLDRNGWSRSLVAKELGIARSTLYEKMRKFGIRDAALLNH